MKPAMSVTTLFIATSLMAGCASVSTSQGQIISVDTPGCQGAICNISNEKGTWIVATPNSVKVVPTFGDLQISCATDGAKTVSAKIASATKQSAYGNVIAGGLLGAMIDNAKGASYEYPPTISIPMSCVGQSK